jgi:uncharacterized protein YqjF (DUF2071 family)
MKQTWYDLLFAHWEIDPELIKPYIPSSLQLDTYQGRAWIAVVPFRMSGIRLRYMPQIPFTSKFPEINVRTYVTYQGKPGVYFFSLDASNFLAVKVANSFFHLPYFLSEMAVSSEGDSIYYQSNRAKEEIRFKGKYQPISDVFYAEFGSLEYWLSERYCLYTEKENRLYRGEIHHRPWSLQEAKAEIYENTMININGFSPFKSNPILHFAKRLEVLLWGIEEV